MRTLTGTATWVFAISLPVLLMTASIWWAANSRRLYTSGFARYDVAGKAGISETDLDRVAAALIGYFNSDEDLVSVRVSLDGQETELFTREEALHFRDVKGLFRLDSFVLLGTAIYCGAFIVVSLWRRTWRRLARSFIAGSAVTLGVMLLLGIGLLVDFDWLFLQFHFLAFTNDLWSAQGYMLSLFPGGFWYDVVGYCTAATGGTALVLGLGASGYLLALRRKEHNRSERTEDGHDS